AGTVNGVTFTGFGTLAGGNLPNTYQVSSGASLSGVLNGGGGFNTIVGPNAVTTWTISGANKGFIRGVVAFFNVQNLLGGTAGNTFAFIANGARESGAVYGNAGSDTLDFSALTSPVTVNLAS